VTELTPTQQQLKEAQALLGRDAAPQAAAIAAQLLADDASHVEAGYTLAVAQRLQHQWQEALSTLRRVIEQKPAFGRAHQESGNNHIALQQFTEAGRSFEAAVAHDPSLKHSWKCLVKLYRDSGNEEKQRRAQDQLTFLETLPAELLTVISYMSSDQLVDAERLCRYYCH
jgi:tetratricopeptide (TPR) repeat protein